MRFAHMIVSQSGRDLTTVCGMSCRLGSKELFWRRFTVWSSSVTCKRCKAAIVERQALAVEMNRSAEEAARG